MSDADEKMRAVIERTSVHLEVIARKLEGSGFSALDANKVREWKLELEAALAAAQGQPEKGK